MRVLRWWAKLQLVHSLGEDVHVSLVISIHSRRFSCGCFERRLVAQSSHPSVNRERIMFTSTGARWPEKERDSLSLHHHQHHEELSQWKGPLCLNSIKGSPAGSWTHNRQNNSNWQVFFFLSRPWPNCAVGQVAGGGSFAAPPPSASTNRCSSRSLHLNSKVASREGSSSSVEILCPLVAATVQSSCRRRSSREQAYHFQRHPSSSGGKSEILRHRRRLTRKQDTHWGAEFLLCIWARLSRRRPGTASKNND